MRALNEGARALALWVAIAVDVAEKHPDAAKRQEADDLVALMTPIIKSFFTDAGFEVTNLGMQVYGGHGYIREHGMEQLVRDARIAQIYEGANGIQRTEEHTAELQSLMRISYAVFCLKQKHHH